jgi:hypothetical protein
LCAGKTTVGRLAVELGLSDEQFRQALAHAQVQAEQAANRIKSKMNTATSGGPQQGGNQGFSGLALNFSRAMDDIQYGVQGVINNMELIGINAAKSFGLSTASAMAFGSALTLTAIALNNVGKDIEKLVDMRTEWQKLTDGPTAFAGSIVLASEKMKQLQKQTQELSQKDATQGFRAVASRIAGQVADLNDQYGSGGETLFSKMIRSLNPQSMEDQIRTNRVTGEQIARNRVQVGIESVGAMQDSDSFNAGLKLIGQQRKGDREIGDEYKKAFEMAAEGQAETISDSLFKQNLASGMNQVDAEQEAIKLLGEAATGVKEAFDEIAKRVPDLKLPEKLESIYESEASINRQKFIDDQNKKRETLEGKAEDMRDRLASLQSQRMRSEIVGSADVFARNLNAGTGEGDPVVKAIEKQTEEYKMVMKEIAGLS